MKTILIYSLFFFLVFGNDGPKEPNLPSLAEEKDSKKEKKNHQIGVNVKLCDGRQISGKIEYENEELNIKHLKNGIKFEKKISIKDLKLFKILTWSLKKQKKVKDGTIYLAKPEKVILQNSNEEKITITGLDETEFQILKLTNQNGKTKLYTFWSDLLYPNGNWFSKLGATSSFERSECFPDVVKEVNFE